MTDPFFTRKRKVTETTPSASSKKLKRKPTPTISIADDEEILSDDETGPGIAESDGSITESESDRETPAEKRRRLAKQYIESVKKKIGWYWSGVFCFFCFCFVRAGRIDLPP